MPKTYSIKESAEILKVAAVTLRLWERQGKITSSRTPGGQRRYSEEDLANIRSLINRPRIQSPLTPPAPQPKLHTIAKTAKILGVSAVTLRLWERQGKISSSRTIGGQRRYTQDNINNIRSLANQPRIQTPATPPLPRPKFHLTFPQKRVLSATLATLIISATGFTAARFGFISKPSADSTIRGAVLASQTALEDLRFTVNVPALFKKALTIEGNLTAPNILYGLKPGTNINITTGQTPTISATDQTTDLKIFKGVKVGSDTISAGSKADTLELVAGDNVTLSANTSDKKITIKSAVTDVTTSGWTDDGSILRLTTAGNLVSIGAASGAAKLNINTDENRDLITASQSGNLKFRLTSTGVIDTGTWQATPIANAYLANSAVTITAGTGLSGGGTVSLGDTVTLSLPTVTTVLGGTNITSYTTGDILYASATNTLSKLGIGSADQILAVSNGLPIWTSSVTGPGTGVFGFWQRSAGAIAPAYLTDDLLVGGTSTASAVFRVQSGTGSVTIGDSGTLTLPNSNTLTGQSGNIQLSGGISLGGGTTYYVNSSGNANFNALNASTSVLGSTTVTSLTDSGSATVSGALTLYGSPTLATTNMVSLTIGNANTGNIIFANAAVANSTLTLPNSNTLSGITNYLQLSQGVSVGGSSTYYINSAGSANLNTLTVNSSASVSGALTFFGTPTISTTAKQSLTLGDTDTGNIVFSGFSTGVLLTNTSGAISYSNGTNGQVLTVSGGVPSWGTVNGSSCTDCLITDPGSIQTITPTANVTGLRVAQASAGTADVFSVTNNGSTAKYFAIDSSGNATASGNLTFDSAAVIQTTKNQSLTLGGGRVLLNSVPLSAPLPVSITDTALNGTLRQSIVDAINDIYTIASGGGGSSGYWQLIDKVVSPSNSTFDLALGNNATSSAKFQIFGTSGNATTSGNLVFSSTPTIATTAKLSLTLGDTNTGNIVIPNPLALSSTVTQSGTGQVTFTGNVDATNGLDVTTANLTVGGTNFSVDPATGNVTLPNSNTLAGVSGYFQASAGISVGGATTYYINNLGTANFNGLTAGTTSLGGTTVTSFTDQGTASISGALVLYGTPTLATTNKQSLTIGDSNTGNIVINSPITTGTWNGSVIGPAYGGTGVANNAASTLTISGNFASTLTVSGITAVTLPTSGTLYGTATNSITSSQLLTSLSDETGSGVAVFGTSPAITTSLTTPSTSFDLVNTTATTVNFAGAATALNIGATTGTTTINNAASISGNLTFSGARTIAGASMASLTIGDANTGNVTLTSGNLTQLQAGGTTTGSTGTSSIYFLNSSGTVRGRFDTALNFGDGTDGAATITTSINLSTASIGADSDNNGTSADSIATNITAAVSSGSVLTVASTTGFVSDDEVLIIQMNGTGVGNYETGIVSAVNSSTQITLKGIITKSYQSTSAQVVRIPQYTNVTINNGGSLTVSAWNGTTGGVLFFRVSGTLTNNSTTTVGIDLSGKGGAGGAAGTTGGAASSAVTCTDIMGSNGNNGTVGADGSAGTGSGHGNGGGGGGYGGYGIYYAASSLNSGGGGGASGGGGAGGSYGATASSGAGGADGGDGGTSSSRGTGGTAGTAGTAGSAQGNADLTALFIGSGGGGGARGGSGGSGSCVSVSAGASSVGGAGGAGGSGGAGGAGGGILVISANTVTLAASSSIKSQGSAGANGSNGSNGSNGTVSTNRKGTGGGGGGMGGGGGGGAGGSILLNAGTLTNNGNNLSTDGVAAGSNGTGATKGGDGGTCVTTAGTSEGGGGGGKSGTGGSTGCTNAGANGASSNSGNGSAGTIGRYATTSSPPGTYGTLYAGSVNTVSADLAEYYVSGDKSISAGDIVSISNTKILDPGGEELVNQGVLRKADKPYDSKLIGVISTNPGVILGSMDGDTGKADKRILALSGRVPVKIDPDSEPIAVGDFLTSSDKPGLATKATKAGYTIAKSLENWTPGGPTSIEAFVNLGYYMGPLTADGYLQTDQKFIASDIKVKLPAPASTVATDSAQFVDVSVAQALGDLMARVEKLEATSSATLTNSLWQYATESGKLMTTLPVQVPELTVTGKLTIGLLSFDDLEASISSLTGTITVKGDLAVTGKIRVLGDSIGEATLASGSASLTIETAAASTTSSIFVTPQKIPVPVSAEATQDGQFVIRIPQSLSDDLKVKWWIVN